MLFSKDFDHDENSLSEKQYFNSDYEEKDDFFNIEERDDKSMAHSLMKNCDLVKNL